MKKKGANNTYFGNIKEGVRSSLIGLKLSIKHAFEARQRRKPADSIATPAYFEQQTGRVTTQYPYEAIPVPDNGRYRLFNEMDDCIVCDKCAKICPVDCIDIEPIRATGQIGTASDGSPIRLYAATFDIDMAKCCYCGLCTTVCPTECLTMTKAYDYSEVDITDMIYHFSNLTPDQVQEKKDLFEQYMKEKEATKKQMAQVKGEETKVKPAVKKPVAKRPAIKKTIEGTQAQENAATTKPKTGFKPRMKPKTDTTNTGEDKGHKVIPSKPKVKRPVIKKPTSQQEGETNEPKAEAKPKRVRPVIKKPTSQQEGDTNEP
uniref:4Fe-4S binding protein n=1 Tax=uncultured Microscilla sp. TaxID=432653 RepID=UPI002618CF25